PSVPRLHTRMSGVATAGVVLQLVMHHWQVPAALPDGGEVPVRRREHELGQLGVLPQSADALQVLLGGPSPVVPDAVEAHDLVHGVTHLARTAPDVLVELLAPGAVLEGDAEGEHP